MIPTDLWAKIRVLAGALSAKLAAAQAALVALATLVPFLPAAWQIKAVAGLVLTAAWVRTLAELVARVTPVPPEVSEGST